MGASKMNRVLTDSEFCWRGLSGHKPQAMRNTYHRCIAVTGASYVERCSRATPVLTPNDLASRAAAIPC